jgi:F-box protein 11
MLSSTQFCENCGAANRPHAIFCVSCGQRQTPAGGQASTSLTGLLVAHHLLKQRYHIISQLGQGGFGAVYKTEDTLFGNALRAVKEMSQSGLSTQELNEAIDAFKREAFLLAGLMHPNLPRIYDHFHDGGRWYLVMDYIAGETLETRLNTASGGKLPIEEVLNIGIQLSTVLTYLHTHQPPIIFRDLKPTNVMVTVDGHLYLIDFGIARLFKPGKAKDTLILGSPGYAASEQLCCFRAIWQSANNCQC